MQIDFAALDQLQSELGTAAVIVMNRQTDVIRTSLSFSSFTNMKILPIYALQKKTFWLVDTLEHFQINNAYYAKNRYVL